MPLSHRCRPEASPAGYDVIAGAVAMGTVIQSSLPGDDRSSKLGKPRQFEGVADSLEAAKTAVRQAWQRWCRPASWTRKQARRPRARVLLKRTIGSRLRDFGRVALLRPKGD